MTTITEQIENLKGMRKTERNEAIRDLTASFYRWLVSNDYKTFSRSLMVSLFPSNIELRQQQRIIKDVLSILLKNYPVKEETFYKSYYDLVNTPLVSVDSGSFSLMMSKNGYVLETKTDYDKNGNAYEYKTYKETLQRQRQGVFTRGSLSIRKRHIKKAVKRFVLL